MSKDYLRQNQGDYPVYSSQTQNNGVFGRIDTFDFCEDSITWTTDGANAGSVFLHEGEKFSITNVCGILTLFPDVEVDLRFLFQWLKLTAPRYVNRGMGNPKLMSTTMKNIAVPVPSFSRQVEIANVLTQFEMLMGDLNSGLPAEINARRKQYEYYRDKLLSFEELK